MNMKDMEMGPGQMRVMRIVWEKKRITANEIIEIMNEEDDVKRSTVQTFLKTLVRKGLLGYDTEDRTFIYFPLVSKDDVAHHALHGFLDHMFEGSMEGLVSFLVNKEKISPRELDIINGLIDRGKRDFSRHDTDKDGNSMD